MTGCPVTAAFRAHAAATPNAPAVLCRDGTVVTFADLAAQADSIAADLLARRGEGSEPVALAVADLARMLAAQLGVLAAGKFYVAINPHFPPARQQAMLRQVRPALLLTDKEAVAAGCVVPGPDGPERVSVEPVLDAAGTVAAPDVSVDPDDYAYVLYTSGSTGEPRGIAQSRRDMAQNVERHAALAVSGTDRATLISADGFLSAISNVYLPVLNGAAVAPYSFHADGVHELVPWLRSVRASVYYSFPSFLRQAAAVAEGATAPDVRLAYLGGEPVHSADLAAARALFPHAALAVGLNSTETGLTRLWVLAPGSPLPDRVTVGAAVPGVEVVLCDERGDAIATGTPGEVVVRSPFVRPRLWGAGTVSDLATGPDETGRWAYRTGDRGVLTGDGDLVHLGRSDAMVKIRGFRVELVEVETALSALDEVTEAAVVAHESEPGAAELAAYVIPARPGLAATELRRRLAALVPPAMVPATVIFVDALPRTSNGKVDRRHLPAIPAAPVTEAPAPEHSVEQQVLAIWRAVLRAPTLTTDDDFFDAGGTSITALSVISRVRRDFGVPVRLAVLFNTPTVAALAAEIRCLQAVATEEEQ